MKATDGEFSFETKNLHLRGGRRGISCILSRKISLSPTKSKVLHIGIGVSVCSPEDQFSPSKGLKFALERAIHSSGLDKADRAHVWALWRNAQLQEDGLILEVIALSFPKVVPPIQDKKKPLKSRPIKKLANRKKAA